MLIKNKKWKNIFLLCTALFTLVIIIDILPALTDNISAAWHSVTAGGGNSDIKALEREYSELNLENKELLSRLNKKEAGFSGSQKLSEIISSLDELALRNDIKITLIKPSPVVKKESIVTQNIELALHGKYKNLYSYIKAVEEAPALIVIKEMNIKPKAELNDSLLIKAQYEVYLN